MANDLIGPDDARRATDRVDPALLADDSADPLLAALGYEAADPALQARLWGEPVLELRS